MNPKEENSLVESLNMTQLIQYHLIKLCNVMGDTERSREFDLEKIFKSNNRILTNAMLYSDHFKTKKNFSIPTFEIISAHTLKKYGMTVRDSTIELKDCNEYAKLLAWKLATESEFVKANMLKVMYYEILHYNIKLYPYYNSKKYQDRIHFDSSYFFTIQSKFNKFLDDYSELLEKNYTSKKGNSLMEEFSKHFANISFNLNISDGNSDTKISSMISKSLEPFLNSQMIFSLNADVLLDYLNFIIRMDKASELKAEKARKLFEKHYDLVYYKRNNYTIKDYIDSAVTMQGKALNKWYRDNDINGFKELTKKNGR